MKKLVIVFAILISVVVLPSCTKQTNNKFTASLKFDTNPFKKDLGTAD